MEKLRVRIQNLTCASCVPQIEQVMRQQEGVIWASVNFAAGEATILFDPVAFSAPQLVQAVGLLGFRIVSGEESDSSSQIDCLLLGHQRCRHLHLRWKRQR